MKRKSLIAAVLSVSLILSACSPSKVVKTIQHQKEEASLAEAQTSPAATKKPTTEPATPVPAQQNNGPVNKETIFVYMVASNLESEGGLATADLKEMMTSGYDPNTVEVVVCAGGAGKWHNNEVDGNSCNVYKLGNKRLTKEYKMQNDNMGDPNTLTEFLEYGYKNHKADRYGLVLWDHGGGAILGYGADEKYKYDALTMAELKNSLSSTQLGSGKQFEWIGFDACLMGMLEVANTLSPYTKYMIASEEVESGAGWNYKFLSDLNDKQHFDGNKTAQSIIDHYEDFFKQNYTYPPDYTLACLDLEKTKDVSGSLDKFVTTAEGTLKEGGYSKIAKVRDKTKSFGKVSDTSFYDTIDLYDLAERMKPMYQNESQELQKSIESMVLYKKSNVSNANGLAVYFPYENKKYAKQWLTAYSQCGFSTTYQGFLKDFTATLSGEHLTEWSISDTTPTQSTTDPGTYGIQLTQAQMDHYAHSKYTIWEEDSKDTYLCWLMSTEVNLSSSGFLSSNFSGKRFFIGDTSGHSVPCTAIELERTDDYAVYGLSLIVIGEGLKSKIAYAHVKVTKEHPDGVIVGIYNKLDTGTNLFPDKNTVTIKERETVLPFYFGRKIAFKPDGHVDAFSKWKSASGTGKGFDLKGQLTVTRKDPDKGEKFCCLFNVTDTQGNSSFTNPVYIKK